MAATLQATEYKVGRISGCLLDCFTVEQAKRKNKFRSLAGKKVCERGII
jgi:hypothetical protein